MVQEKTFYFPLKYYLLNFNLTIKQLIFRKASKLKFFIGQVKIITSSTRMMRD